MELLPEDELWRWLYSEMAGATPPDGTFPLPSEEDRVLDRVGIHHPENRRFARDMLRPVWAGRSEGLSARFERPPKPTKRPKG